MKKFLLALSLMIACIACIFAVACADGTYTYSFDTDGGDAIKSVEVEKGGSYVLPTPEKEGFGFEGWYLTEDFSGDPVTEISSADKDLTFYAKWEQLATITLDLDGGTLAGVDGNKLYLAAGENIAEFMADYVPVKSGLTFGAWFNGESELSASIPMPENGITLVAHYKVDYTIQLYLQNEERNGYELSDEVVTASDYVGAEVTATYEVAGFSQTTNSDEKLTAELSATASENVFKIYFDRNEFRVTFDANYPDGSASESNSVSGYYGVAVTLPYDYSFEGYMLIGWSESSSGNSIDYPLNYIDSIIYNGEGGEVEDVTFMPERNITLYGVWLKGYTDMFGGNDYIYVLTSSADDNAEYNIYLCRGDVYFKADFVGTDGTTFRFDISDEDVLEGRLNADGTFIYLNTDRDNYTASLFVPGVGLDKNITISFDAYNGVTYYDANDGSTLTADGTYTIDENGYYVITFTEADEELSYLLDAPMVISRGVYSGSGAADNAFQIRNEEQVALGWISRGVVAQDNAGRYVLTYYVNNIGGVMLDGFSTAYLNNGSEITAYAYLMDEDGNGFSLYDLESGSSVGFTAKLVKINGTNCFMLYDEELNATYTAADGSTLVLDGAYAATYTNGTTVINGIYTTSVNSVFGGTVVIFTPEQADLGAMTFLVKAETSDISGEEVTTYSFAQKGNGYAEYSYKDSSSTGPQNAPLIVLNETAEGSMSVYGYSTTEGKFILVSTGTYTYDEEEGTYSYTATQTDAQAKIDKEPVDLTKVKSIVFRTDIAVVGTSGYNVNYWYSAVFVGEDGQTDVTEDFVGAVYTNATTGGKLTLVGGFAVLDEGGQKVAGVYSADSNNANLLKISVVVNSQINYVYVELGESNTYITLDSAPYTSTAIAEDGKAAEDETLAFDGKGGAVYTAGKDVQPVSGTVENTSETTVNGYYIFTFKALDDSLTFNFIQLQNSSEMFFVKYNADWDGTFYGANGGMLDLDGYGFGSVYTDVDGNEYEGVYYYILDADSVVQLYTETRIFYFDFAGETFKVRGQEYATYAVMDNNTFTGLYVTLDGYDEFSVFSLNEDGEQVEVRSGTYTQADGVFTLTYEGGATMVGGRGIYYISSTQAINVFIISHTEVVRTYVNQADWSVLELNAYGNVTRYSSEGVMETGTYTIVTPQLLYFANSAGTDASLYNYDVVAGTITPVNLVDRGYYTENLESLIFTKYGFAIFNGEVRNYYNLNSEGEIVIYRQATEEEIAAGEDNGYGFIEESLGFRFSNTITYDGNTYYENDGYQLIFSRAEATANNYPVHVTETEVSPLGELNFMPSGSSEFGVSGYVLLKDGTELPCTVVRELNDEGGYDLYIMVSANVGYFRFDITVDYRGVDETGKSNNTYEITSMSLYQTTTSEDYQMLVLIAMLTGSATPANTYGEISLINKYDVNGEVSASGFSAWFGESVGMTYPDGTPISFDFQSYTYNEENGLYEVPVDLGDGYSYTFCFQLSSGLMGTTYKAALVRNQTLTDAASGITAELSRVVAGAGYSKGALFDIKLVKDGVDIPATTIGYINEDFYYISRVLDDDGKITSTTYYKIVLAEAVPGEGDTEDTVLTYQSVSITVEQITTYSTADGSIFIDVDAQNNVRIIKIGTSLYLPVSSSYNAETKTYTVVLSDTISYVVTINEDGTATATEVAAEEEDQANQQ